MLLSRVSKAYTTSHELHACKTCMTTVRLTPRRIRCKYSNYSYDYSGVYGRCMLRHADDARCALRGAMTRGTLVRVPHLLVDAEPEADDDAAQEGHQEVAGAHHAHALVELTGIVST